MVADSVSRIARFVSLSICLVALASFVGFAVEQSKGASQHQQSELAESAPAWQRAAAPKADAPANEDALRKAIDGVFAKLASPFSSLTHGISGEWTLHIANLLLALLVYGFGLGLLARLVRFGD
jgi:hypothetical protein